MWDIVPPGAVGRDISGSLARPAAGGSHAAAALRAVL